MASMTVVRPRDIADHVGVGRRSRHPDLFFAIPNASETPGPWANFLINWIAMLLSPAGAYAASPCSRPYLWSETLRFLKASPQPSQLTAEGLMLIARLGVLPGLSLLLSVILRSGGSGLLSAM